MKFKNINRKALLFLTVFVLMFICKFTKTDAATFSDLNQSEMFLKQTTNYTCTLSAATMMVRRTALATGNANWKSITENTMRGTAWLEGSGLYYNFSYAGITVSHNNLLGGSNNTSQLISLLNSHPEGIVIYDRDVPHAILITDYTDGVFYCADPANNTVTGRIPISLASITIFNADEYWYVSSPQISVNKYNNPEGEFEFAAGGYGTIRIRGYAYDRDNLSQSLKIHIYIDGVYTGEWIADNLRTDLSDVGDNHGFDFPIFTEHSGEHTVSVYAINIGEGDASTCLGNKTVTLQTGFSPQGMIDSITGGEGSIRIKGWAFDRDNLDTPLEIHIYADGYGSDHFIGKFTANYYRPDLSEGFAGVSPNHGFNTFLRTSLTGRHEIFITAINIGTGENISLGSKTVNIAPIDHNPRGAIEKIVGGEGEIFIQGWAFDYDNPSTSLEIHVYADGYGIEHWVGKCIANCYRKDLPEGFSKNGVEGLSENLGYCISLPTTLEGMHEIFITAINIDAGENISLGSQTIEIKPRKQDETEIHTHNYVSVVTKAATCTEDGIQTFTCKNGDDSYEEIIPATGHQHTEIRNATTATCTQNGYTGDVYCTDCNTMLSSGELIVKKEHTWDNGIFTTPATCTEKGIKTYACTVCHETKTEEIPATGHRNTEVRNIKAATCMQEGYTGDTYCKDCNTKISSGEIVGRTAHTWDNGTVVKNATCTESGSKISTCIVCQTTKTEDILPTGHIGEMEIRNTVQATCRNEGYSGDTYCTACGEKISSGSLIPKKAHSWNSGFIAKAPNCVTSGEKIYTCVNCEETKTETLPATGHSKETVVKNVLPATCLTDGYSGDSYCKSCGQLLYKGQRIAASGHIWDAGITTAQPTASTNGVKTYTCKKCKATRTETIKAKGLQVGTVIKDTKSNGIYKILKDGLTAEFTKPINKKKTAIKIPDTVIYKGVVCKVTSVGVNAFKSNKYIKTIKIGNNVTSINNNCFYSCAKLSSVTLGKNVATIGTNAFAKCTAISKITIPANVTKIGKQAFYGCKKLKSITIKASKLTSKTVGTNAFKGIYKKPTVAVPKSVYTSYRKMLKAKGIGSKAKYKKF